MNSLSLLPAKTSYVDDSVFTAMGYGLIIGGVLVLVSVALPKIGIVQRIITGLVGLAFLGYGIYVLQPTTMTVQTGVYLFAIPLVCIVANLRVFLTNRRKAPEAGNYNPSANPPGYQPGQQNSFQPPQGGYAPNQQQAPYGAGPAAPQNNGGYTPAPGNQPGQNGTANQSNTPQQQYQQPTDPTA